MKFYDRVDEMNVLLQNESQALSEATFTVLMGRRRVGKTSLLFHTFQGKTYAYLFVSKDNESMLCKKFQETLEQQLGLKIYGSVTRFKELFKIIMQESANRHFTLIFDEFQNFQKVNPSIFSDIQDVWDQYHTQSKINLIACGSIQSLMKRIFENEDQPLYGRPTSKFTLYPFKISTLKEILSDVNPNYKNEDLLCLYMITGGVAKYVELLIDAECYTYSQMLDYVCRRDSYFITEGKDLVNQEFSNEGSTYFSILQLIAQGLTRRSEIDGALAMDAGTYLQNLEQNFGMISRVKPILSKPNSKVSTYEISDNFLRFWFRFICPYQALLERGLVDMIRQNITKNYSQFSGKTLEKYFHQKFMESGEYAQIGNWWDRKGEKEIDMIALNEFTKTGIAAEIKRNPDKINPAQLAEKISALPAEFSSYTLSTLSLSVEDM